MANTPTVSGRGRSDEAAIQLNASCNALDVCDNPVSVAENYHLHSGGSLDIICGGGEK